MSDKQFNEDTLRALREKEFEVAGRHIDRLYEKESHKHRKTLINDLLSTYLPLYKNKASLDFGCAEGIYCEYLESIGAKNIHGCDIASNKIMEAQKLYKDSSIHFQTLTEWRNTNQIKYGLILCLETLQHIPSYKETLKELFSVLDTNGLLLLSIPNLSSEKGQHVFADVNAQQSINDLLTQVGGAGLGKQNAFWKFDTDLFEQDLADLFDNKIKLIKTVKVNTPDGERQNLWTLLLFQKL